MPGAPHWCVWNAKIGPKPGWCRKKENRQIEQLQKQEVDLIRLIHKLEKDA
jgi:hypothetical protein